ncbi:LysR family transcriptional regulator [Herbaspirillum chlorophenolicum]|uniref:LysR family transcriptional regulator n=1 Tax=Herbaspirillum chlorophenolicum TaxID=211589 RepID=UPI0012E12575|nr:LysR family transcriptional regulator [Herbaspirillum chlorophenolicum]
MGLEAFLRANSSSPAAPFLGFAHLIIRVANSTAQTISTASNPAYTPCIEIRDNTMQDSRLIDMQALRIFVATAQDCNMSRTAKKLGISQSAVSQTIRMLEDSVGAPLLNRTVRPLTLTPAGIALFNRGRALLDDACNIRSAVLDASREAKPSLRIGLVDSFAATCGTHLVQQLLQVTNQLAVRTGLTPNLGEALARRELDLVISSRQLDLEEIQSQPLMSERFMLIAPPSAPKCRVAADIATLEKALPIIRFNRQSHLGEQAERALRRIDVNPSHRLEVDTADTLTAMVAGGLGWAVTTPLCLLQGARSAAAVRVDVIEDLNEERTLYLHTRQGQGEYGVLGKEIFGLVQAILDSQVTGELREIDPALPAMTTIHSWR